MKLACADRDENFHTWLLVRDACIEQSEIIRDFYSRFCATDVKVV